MEIRFASPDVGALCNSAAALARRWGHERGALVAQRLAELQALDRLADLAHFAHIEVANTPSGTAVYAGGDIAIVLVSQGVAAEPAERVTVLAVEERREQP